MSSLGNILVVDDEEMNLDLCSRRLRRSGFDVSVAASGKMALEMIADTPFDVVLLDQMMPQMSGLEVLRLLRLNFSSQLLPVIMVTAVAEPGRIAEALDLGADDYITKPIDFTVALARIRSQMTRRQADTALHYGTERYALAAKGTKDGLWDWDLKRNEIYYSPQWRSLLGLPQDDDDKDPETWLSRVHTEDRERLMGTIAAHLSDETNAMQCEYRIKHYDGHYRWMSVRGSAVRSKGKEAHRMVGSQSDITSRATIDALTNLPNRTMFNEHIAIALERLQSPVGPQLAVLMLDLDRFKLVNDSHGHTAGDLLLKSVATRLASAIRNGGWGSHWNPDSIVARLSGDEFSVLIEDLSSVGPAIEAANQICDAMRAPFRINDEEVYCSMCIGIAMAGITTSSADDLLRDADTAMYAAKALGRGRWAIFETAMRQVQQNKLQMDTDLRHALVNSEFEVYYQPRVKLENAEIYGFEALVRWHHPTRGLVSPAEFIPAAEENGLIREIGLWVLREACQQMHAWNSQFPDDVTYDIAVNLSAMQCCDPEIVQQIAEILKETQLPPQCLHLELTESVFLEDMGGTRMILMALKELGIGLKLDDFGMGYSCLKYLAELPFDTLKIDRSFIFDMDQNDQESIEMVRTILLMAAGLKMGVIAEGIEKTEHVLQLRKMGCRFGQGFLFSLPVPAKAAEALLANASQTRRLIATGAATAEGIQ